jgi:hypothetical protein
LEKRGIDTSNQVEVTQAMLQMGLGVDLNMVKIITGDFGHQ